MFSKRKHLFFYFFGSIQFFIRRFPGRGSIELRLRSWWYDYEKQHHAKFYKYIVAKGKQDIKTQFKIERLPTIIFMRNGEDIGRIDNFDESNPDIIDQASMGGQSNDDKLLKKKLVELDKPLDQKKSEQATVATQWRYIFCYSLCYFKASLFRRKKNTTFITFFD